eukprot:4353290-Pyramimonas_sp.AAC.1
MQPRPVEGGKDDRHRRTQPALGVVAGPRPIRTGAGGCQHSRVRICVAPFGNGALYLHPIEDGKGRSAKGRGVDALHAHRKNDMGDFTALPSATHAAESKVMLAPLRQVGHGK